MGSDLSRTNGSFVSLTELGQQYFCNTLTSSICALKDSYILLPDATLSHMVKECKKLFSAFLCSKKRNQKSRLITIDKKVAILLTELILPLPLLGSVAAGHRTIRFLFRLSLCALHKKMSTIC
jgi:hypothetical protein